VAVTDERGGYRIPVRIGLYRLTAELAGFTTLTRSGLELLVGQQSVINLQMAPSALQETVTVTGAAPLIETTTSVLGGNIDTKQITQLPINGRNWLELTILAPGSRANAVTESPMVVGNAFQINVDGQQVSLNIAGSAIGQPRFSQDAIAEFEFVANRFDATQGRSSGVQINVVSKSGTNLYAGSMAGYFRSDRFNAADKIQNRVLPYSNQQVSVTFGGPIRRDRIHYFGNYEYEREPQTFTYNSPFPRFNIDQAGTRTEKKGGARMDVQFTPRTRLMVRGSKYRRTTPFDPNVSGGASNHPSFSTTDGRWSTQGHGTLTHVLSNRAVNETKVGYTHYWFEHMPNVKNPNSPTGRGDGAPLISMRGYTIGHASNAPIEEDGDQWQIRNDFTYSFNRGGRHTLVTGGEYIPHLTRLKQCDRCNGIIDATGGPIPANIEDLFPVWNDVSTWNLAGISPITVRYTLLPIEGYDWIETPKNIVAAWAQDDWQVTSRLTLNLGVRYDVETGATAEEFGLPPFVPNNRSYDTNNIAPRLGAAFSLNDRTVIRGGWGKFFESVDAATSNRFRLFQIQAATSRQNDGRPDFAANPFNGPPPSRAQVLALGLPVDYPSSMISSTFQFPYSYQSSIGVQRQIGGTMAVQADYVWSGNRHQTNGSRNANMTLNPATGANYPYNDRSTRLYPDQFGVVNIRYSDDYANYHGLQTAFTKRFSNKWQAAATYTLSGFWDVANVYTQDQFPAPPVGFKPAPDIGGEYTLAQGDQRHRAVFNGIWEPGYGFVVSGLYFFGSGLRYNTTYGGDLRNTGNISSGRLRPNGTIVPRSNLVGKPLHRVDLRVQKRFRLGVRAGVDGFAEVFNLFNHSNYGAYVTAESNARYGQPTTGATTAGLIAYGPRVGQLGVRFAF
jgi:hypothetical protein